MTFATNLGFLPGGLSFSQAVGCNSDGTVIVGFAADAIYQQPVYWDAADVIHQLPILPGAVPGPDAQASACSSDGSVIVGTTGLHATIDKFAVQWTGGPSWVATALQFIPGTGNGASAWGCSGDASVVCGWASDALTALTFPCVWVGGTIALLPLPGGHDEGVAFAVSSDGSTVAGYAGNSVSGNLTPVIWTGGPGWAVTILGALAGGSAGPTSSGYGCSSNGGIIVGSASDSGGDTHAVSWSALTPTSLAGANSAARGCDATGSVVGGSDVSGLAIVWTSGSGVNLPLFTGAQSVNLAAAISQDASIFVGWGIDVDGNQTAVKWTGGSPPPPPASGPPGFLICGNDWTITQPVTKLYGFDHLIGRDVVGLADGVPLDPITVAADGSVTLPFAASYVTLGLAFTVQMQTPYIDTGNPTAQGRRKNITAVTVRVDASGAPFSGTNQPDGGSFTPTQVGPAWSNMQPSVTQDPEQFPGTYLSPAGETVTLLFSGDFRANLQPGWDERGQVAVEQTLPVPLSITAVVPELLQGDTAEQTYAQQQGGGGQGDDSRGPGLWMLTSRGRR